ncbi:MAG: 4Fe-4S dicluster domain-containing protein [Nakamurella sp.]
MPYVIALPCVDCICEGGRSLYIHPDECIDCGACEPVCQVEATFYSDDLPTQWQEYQADNERFFTERLPGRDEPLKSPAGAARLGVLDVDTPMVAALPPQSG